MLASIAELGFSVTKPLPPIAPTAARRSGPVLAVLAFDNLSADPELAYFSDGVSEEILQAVSRAAGVTVIGRASSFQFRGAAKAARRIVAELNVTHLLDGSVRRSGPRVRISAQLVDCASETTVWSDRFDRELSDVFALQDEIAEAVAAALKVVLAPAAAAEKIDPAAYDLYLRAPRTLWVDQNAAPSIELLQQAVARAPRFAAAWAALCWARVNQARRGPRPAPFAVLKAAAVEAAETALRLDPNAGLAAALSSLQPIGRYQEREAPAAPGARGGAGRARDHHPLRRLLQSCGLHRGGGRPPEARL